MLAQDYGEKARSLAQRGDFGESERMLRRGVADFPNNPKLRVALASLLLARGAFVEGWELYESRRHVPHGPRDPKFPFPEWNGEIVNSLLVLPEQGFGDKIQFARYVPLLVARGIEVTLVVPPPLLRLFSSLGASLIEARGPVEVPRHDAWCHIGSLPHLTGDLPVKPYLRGSENGRGLGVMLEGSGNNGFALPPRMRENLSASGISLHPSDTGANDFEDTAEIIRSLEIVISVDTSVAHLAGAMGKKVYVILPRWPDWRWGHISSRSIWYPSARLFRLA